MDLSLHYDFEQQGSLEPKNNQGPTLPMDRASSAPITDRGGWIKYVTDDIPRMYGAHYNDNILLKSEDQLDIADWGNGGSGLVRTGGFLDPWDTFKAVELRDDNRGGAFVTRIQQEQTHDGNGTYLYAWYLKEAPNSSNGGWASISLQNTGGTPASPAAFFNVAEGYVGTTQTVYDAKITPVANGFYRCSFVADFKDGDGSSTWLCSVADGDGDGSLTMDGTNAIICVGAHGANVSGLWTGRNDALYSEQFQSWINQSEAGEPLTVNIANPVDGRIGVNELVDDGGGGAGQALWSLNNVDIVPGGTYFHSMYVKKKPGGDDYASMHIVNVGGAPSYQTFWNIVDGTVATQAAGAEDAGAERLRDGWWRIWQKVRIVDNADLVATCRLYLTENGTNVSLTDTDGTHGYYAFGHQFEPAKPNQTKPGAYTPTTDVKNQTYSVPNYIVTDTERVSFVTGPCDGYKPEGSRTNLLLRSNELSEVASAWNTPVNGATPDADVTFFIDGTKSMDRLVDNGATGTGSVRFGQNVTVATSSRYACSIWFKADELEWGYIRANGFTTPATSIAYFDLANGVLGTVDAGFADADIEDWGNGLYRCWVSFDTDAADTTGTMQFGPADADLDDVVDLDGTSSIFAGGAQFELGTTPSGYIPTAGVTGTKAADNITVIGIDDWYDLDTGLWYARFQNDERGYQNRFILEVSDGSSSDRNYLNLQGDTLAQHWRNATGDGDSVNLTAAIVDVAETQALSTAYNANEANFFLNEVGSIANPDTTPATGGLHDRINIGHSFTNTSHFHGLIKEIRFYRNVANITIDQLQRISNVNNPIFPGYDKKKQAKQKAIDAAIWNKTMNARTREARSESEEDYVPYNNIG
jgi:hypothetical protein